MKRLLFILIGCLSLGATAQTLEECQQAASSNYPLIRQYDLIARTTDLTVANINKAWLPQVAASAQATYQSDVASWPEQMQTMLGQMGLEMEGLKKDQYRVGIDVNQTLYDGGTIRSQAAIAREQGNVDAAQTEVNLYAIRQRVNEMYFALLLLDENIKLNQDMQDLLATSEKKLESMYRHGTAAESDYNAIRAERLNVVQQMSVLKSQRQALTRMLSAFCGIEVNEPVKPAASEVTLATNNRPELALFDSQLRLAAARDRQLDAQLMPRLNLFASGFYGYPGYNMFEDMVRHRWSLNGMVGVKLNWNIGSLYTRHNDKAAVNLQRQMIETNRETFLYNNRLDKIRLDEELSLYRDLVKQDDEIISLRTSVRKSAQSRLNHGIIDINDLLKEINNEHAALVTRSTHEIEALKRIYDIKFTLNN
ncbi:MAG: TolC family protein [Muribaculaceae bacterium]|nr:TolC family protein [Muribaculaceae bacterium]